MGSNYYKCLTSNENCEKSINSKSSAKNNINLNNKIYGDRTKYIDRERSREKSEESSRERINTNEINEEKIMSFIKMTSSQLKKKQILHYLIILTQNILKILHKANMD